MTQPSAFPNRIRERRCWAIAKGFSFCRRRGDWLFLCHEHSQRRYLLRVGVAFFTLVAGVASIYGVMVLFFPELLPNSANRLMQYHLAVRTEDEMGTSVDADVHTSVKSIATRSGNLWNIEILSSNLASDRVVIITAENKSEFLKGQTEVILGKEINRTLTVRMIRDRSARALGRVVDEKQNPIVEAHVVVVGYEDDLTNTDENGQFDLPAHAAFREPIRVRVEKIGFTSEEVVIFAGDDSIPIVLARSRR